MSINRLIEISRRSLQAAQAGMDTVSQNVANAETDGYNRRRVTMRADATSARGVTISPSADGATGEGVSIASYERMRDQLLNSAGWEAQAGLGSADEKARVLQAAEAALSTGGGSLQEALNAFWNGWSDVANNPTDVGTRRALLSRARALTDTFHRIDEDLSRLTDETTQTLQQGVEDVNDTLQQIGTLNRQISEARFKGSPDLAAEDRRDALVKELAGFAPIRVSEKDNGYAITVQGMTVVQNDQVSPLKLDPDTSTSPPTQRIRFGDTGVFFNPPEGEDGRLGAWLSTLNQTLPDVRDRLDTMAGELATQVNDEHTGAYDLNGNPGLEFFDAAGDTASSIAVAVASPAEVAASATGTTLGDTTPAQDIAALREPFARDAIELAADVGSQVERASSRVEAQSAVANHLEGMARGVSGVSLDEEMTLLIQHQQSYAASSRVLSTAKTLIDTLLAI